MTVRSGNPAVLIVNHQFTALIPADVSSSVCGILFCIEMTGRAFCSASFNIPTTLSVRYYMMCFPGHTLHLSRRLCVVRYCGVHTSGVG